MKDFFTYHTISYPMINYLTHNNVNSFYFAFLNAISTDQELKNFQEANSNSIWKNAMKEELHAFDKNKTWDIVRLPLGKKIVGCH